MSDPHDKDLLARLKSGDAKALQEIFFRYHSRLCTIAHRVIHDRDGAKDVVQQVFIKLLEKRHELNITSTLEGYLRRATFNTALNDLEKKQKTQPSIPDEVFMRSLGNDVSQEVEYAELELKVIKAIEVLPPRTRAVFTMIRSEGMSYAEVAESLQISQKAVEKEMMKALRLLRQVLHRYLILALTGMVLKDFF